MSRASFAGLKLGDPDLFAVKIGGHLGAKERSKVDELVRKCHEKQKTHVVFDLSELESLGGGVAAVLGDFAAEMSEAGKLLLLVGASDVVRGFLTARFEKAQPVFVGTLVEAEQLCAAHKTGGPAIPAGAHAGPTPVPAREGKRGGAAGGASAAPTGGAPNAAPHATPHTTSHTTPKDATPPPRGRDPHPAPHAATQGGPSATPHAASRADRDAAKPTTAPGPADRPAAKASQRGADRAAGVAATGGKSAGADANGQAAPSIILLPDDNEAAATSAPSPAAGAAPTTSTGSAAGLSTLSGPVTPAQARYLSLDEGLRMCTQAGSLPGMRKVLADLLHGADLADVCLMFHRQGKFLVEVQDGQLKFPCDGAIAGSLIAQAMPVAMIDLGERELGDVEGDLLTTLNCQIAVPVMVHGVLEGVLFLRKKMAGSEYGPCEVMALDLLARRVASMVAKEAPAAPAHGHHEGAPMSRKGRGDGDGEETESQLKRKVYQQKALLGISRDFNSTQDEDHLISLLLLTAIGQVGCGTVVFYDLQDKALVPKAQRGLDDVQLPQLPAPSGDALGRWSEPASVAHTTTGPLREMMHKLRALGLQVAAPVRSKQRTFGILALGPKITGGVASYDDEFLSILLNQTGIALENARLIRELEDRTLGVARTFVSLIEKRGGQADRASTELITHYVGRIAQAMTLPQEKYRDLLYATVLRDIGMIEISDLVLRSPRSLTPEEWRLIKQHPVTGRELLIGMGFNSDITDVVLHHHERFNGEGYPHGLRGAAIPLGARIVAVVESFVAMTRNLPYRAALGWAEALEVMRENWGLRYDPAVLEAFLRILEAEGERKAVPEGVLQSA